MKTAIIFSLFILGAVIARGQSETLTVKAQHGTPVLTGITIKQPIYYDIGFSGYMACSVCRKRPIKGETLILLVVASDSTRVGIRFIHTKCDSTNISNPDNMQPDAQEPEFSDDRNNGWSFIAIGFLLSLAIGLLFLYFLFYFLN